MSTTIRIDKAGRLVVPRKLRQAVGFSEDSELEIEQEGANLVLRHRTPPVRANKEKGVWVFDTQGGVITNEMVNEAVEQGRRGRLRSVLGE